MSKPAGYASVVPYMFVNRAEAFVDFLVQGLGGTELHRSLRDDKIANAQVRIGDAIVMVSEASEQFPAMPGSYYLYVDEADAAMERAIAAGASQIMAVADMPYGDRQGGIRDAHGNIWWLSQHTAPGGYF